MTTTAPEASTVLVPVADPLFTAVERQAPAGFLPGYSELTRDAYSLDLRQYIAWCAQHGLHLFTAKRIDIETFRAAIARRRTTAGERPCDCSARIFIWPRTPGRAPHRF